MTKDEWNEIFDLYDKVRKMWGGLEQWDQEIYDRLVVVLLDAIPYLEAAHDTRKL